MTKRSENKLLDALDSALTSLAVAKYEANNAKDFYTEAEVTKAYETCLTLWFQQEVKVESS